MIPKTRFLFLFLLFAAITGCASSTRYEWNSYDTNLYDHYRDSTGTERFVESLRETIADGEVEGRVPPGIYAEYGFMLYEAGNGPMAIQYYQKEAARWPESRVFMNKMIAVAQNRDKKKSRAVKPADSPDADAIPQLSKPEGAIK